MKIRNALKCLIFGHSSKVTHSTCPYTNNIYTVCNRCNEVIKAIPVDQK